MLSSPGWAILRSVLADLSTLFWSIVIVLPSFSSRLGAVNVGIFHATLHSFIRCFRSVSVSDVDLQWGFPGRPLAVFVRYCSKAMRSMKVVYYVVYRSGLWREKVPL